MNNLYPTHRLLSLQRIWHIDLFLEPLLLLRLLRLRLSNPEYHAAYAISCSAIVIDYTISSSSQNCCAFSTLPTPKSCICYSMSGFACWLSKSFCVVLVTSFLIANAGPYMVDPEKSPTFQAQVLRCNGDKHCAVTKNGICVDAVSAKHADMHIRTLVPVSKLDHESMNLGLCVGATSGAGSVRSNHRTLSPSANQRLRIRFLRH